MVVLENNTFYGNGVDAQGGSPSEINFDVLGAGANLLFSRNILAAGVTALNGCDGSSAPDVHLDDNVVTGPGPSGACVGALLENEPGFVDPAGGDFHTSLPAVAAYGAYAP